MTLQQLTYFLAAAEHGSFTAAADVLRLARPSVSEQVAHLEAELGVALFVRTGRRLQLTDAGRLLVPEAERTLAAAREASDAVRRARTLTGGTASLGPSAPPTTCCCRGSSRTSRGSTPEVAVRVVGENSSQLADAVRAGRLEAGLVALPVDADGLEVGAAVARLEVVYACADPARAREPVTVERLARATLVLPEARWGDDDPTRRQLAERAQHAGVAIAPRIEVQHVTAALELAAGGHGDTLVTRALLDRLGYGDRLPSAPLDPPLHETFAFIARRNVRPSPATSADDPRRAPPRRDLGRGDGRRADDGDRHAQLAHARGQVVAQPLRAALGQRRDQHLVELVLAQRRGDPRVRVLALGDDPVDGHADRVLEQPARAAQRPRRDRRVARVGDQQREPARPGGRPGAHLVDERRRGHGLVRDDQDPSTGRRSTTASLMPRCRDEALTSGGRAASRPRPPRARPPGPVRARGAGRAARPPRPVPRRRR